MPGNCVSYYPSSHTSMTPRCAEQIDRNYKLADQYSRYDLIPIALFLSKFYKNHANLSNLMAIYEYSDSESYLSKYTFICSFLHFIKRSCRPKGGTYCMCKSNEFCIEY